MLSGRALIDALKPTLEKADVRGEVGFVRHMVKQRGMLDDTLVRSPERNVHDLIHTLPTLFARVKIFSRRLMIASRFNIHDRPQFQESSSD